MLRPLILLTAAAILAQSAIAEPTIKVEHLNPADPAWKFKTIPGPSQSDIAQKVTVSVAKGALHTAGGDADMLVNGKITASPSDLSQLAFLADNPDGGCFMFDLGKIQPVTSFNSYSWHEWSFDQGARAPQVYTLYGQTAAQADPSDLSQWTKIAEVDTRPNTTGAQWGGQYGVSIADPAGKLGDFRYLLMAVKPTLSPLQGDKKITHTFYTEVDIHTAETSAKAGDAAVATPVKVTDIWVVFKTHCDLGYTDNPVNVFTKYRVNMMEHALGIIDASRTTSPGQQFSWLLAGWPLKHCLGPLQDPVRKARLERAVREGTIAAHALPVTLHTESFDLEDLTRSLGYSSSIARQYGRPLSQASKMTDVPSHSWALPTVLAQAGVRFFQLGCNGTSANIKVPPLFWWEGPDGSRILCFYTPDYGSGICPPAGWPAKNYLAMLMTYDNHGPPSPQDIENTRRAIAQQMPGARVHFDNMEGFTEAVLAENPDIPVIRADMPDTWIHGIMSMPVETKTARNVRPLMPALELLDTQLPTWGIEPPPLGAALGDAYENSMLYAEHTWGAHGPIGDHKWGRGFMPRRFSYGKDWQALRDKGLYKEYESSFDDHRAYIQTTDAIVRRELDARLGCLARSVKAPAGSAVVFNPLPWPRSGIVEFNGAKLLAKDIPASGYKVVKIPAAGKPEPLALPDNTLETPRYKAVFDLKRGGISSLVDKASSRELVDTASPYVLGQYLHERFDAKRMHDWHQAYAHPPGAAITAYVHLDTPKDLTYAAITPTGWTLSSTRSALCDTVTLTAGDTLGLAQKLEIVFTFKRDGDGLEVDWRPLSKTANPIPEGGWLCFPLTADQPRYTLGRLGAPCNPATEIIKGANFDLYCLNTGMSVTDKNGFAVNLCPLDSPIVSLGEPGLWRYSARYQSPKPTVFVNLYNNMWATNFPYWTEGTWNSRVKLWTTPKDINPTADMTTLSWETRTPLLAVVATGTGKTLPAEQSGVCVSRKGVLVSAFGADPDGNNGTLIRVWEQAGTSGELTVTLGAPSPSSGFSSATPVNLRGEKTGEPLKITDNQLTFPLGKYAPASFILNP